MWISFTGDRARAREHPFKTQEAMTSFPTPGHLSHTVHTQWLSVLSHKAKSSLLGPCLTLSENGKQELGPCTGSSHFLLTPALPVPVHKLLTQVMFFELLRQSQRHTKLGTLKILLMSFLVSHTHTCFPKCPMPFSFMTRFQNKDGGTRSV